MYASLGLYRQLQILNSLYNQLHKQFLAVLIVGVVSGLSLGLAQLVTCLGDGAKREVNILELALYCVTIGDTVFVIVWILGGLVEVREESERCFMKVRILEVRQMFRVKRSWIRRYLRSCPLLKIRFGEKNFMENYTPLRCLDFSVNLTVQFLLVSIVR